MPPKASFLPQSNGTKKSPTTRKAKNIKMGRRLLRKKQGDADYMEDCEEQIPYYATRSFLYTMVSLVIFVMMLRTKVRWDTVLEDYMQQLKEISFSDPQENNREEPEPVIPYTGYKPAPAEAWVMNHTQQLGLTRPNVWAPTCQVLTDPNASPYHDQLSQYVRDLVHYYDRVSKFALPIPDLRRNLTETDHSVCNLLKLHPEGLQGLFSQSGQLSFTASGWTEPLLPFLRHPKFCIAKRYYLLNTDYMVHDFEYLCRQMKPTTRTVFVDMGASLLFHRGARAPTLNLLDLFRKFGFKFDHLYAYEMKPQEPKNVFQAIPVEYEAAYHWINLGVASDKDSRQNPFKLIKENYDEDDIVIVKLDIDTPFLERELANQLETDPELAKLIDHFYFEHHVFQKELEAEWGRGEGITETVAQSLELFTRIRELGVAAHIWV